ncbi:MAG: hypothetical protein LBK06_10510 [Planctomycetaceae bacterium]|jgi:hypothetical protein|nr:hypothetical protein [Planctomycetaceae bacterium]
MPMSELTPIFDIDGGVFSAAKFIWLLLRYDLLVVKTAREVGEVRKQLESVIETFEHKLQRSLPRPEIFAANNTIEFADTIPAGEPDNDQLFKRLKQLETSALNANWYQKNDSNVTKIIIHDLLKNYRNKKSTGECCCILRLNVVGQGGGKFSVIFQNDNLCEIVEGWLRVNVSGNIAAMLRINVNTFTEILNSTNIAAAVQNALTRCQLLLTVTQDSNFNVQKIINLFEAL